MASSARNARSLRAAITEASSVAVQSRLGELALDLNGAALMAPRPDFVAALRTRLVAVASVAPAPAPKASLNEWALSGARSARRTRFATSMIAAAVVVGSAGVAGARSLPGDAFYDIKQAAEGLEMSFTHGDAARGELHLKYAQRRLSELMKLSGSSTAMLTAAGAFTTDRLVSLDGVKKSTLKDIRKTLKAMDHETTAGARLLENAFQATKDRSTMHTLGSFAQAQAERLQTVVADLPAAAQPQALNSLSLVLTVQGKAFVLSASAPLSSNTASTPTSAPTIIVSVSKTPTINDPAQSPTVAALHRGAATGSQSAPTPQGSAATPAQPSSGGSGGSGSQPNSGGTPTGNPSTPTTVTITVPLGVNSCLDVTTLVGLPPVCVADPAK